MSSNPLFTITPATQATITNALDCIITQFGKQCKLVFPARFVRCSNCFTQGTLVSTPSGPVAIESLRPGDEVLGPDGLPRFVAHTFAALYQGLLCKITAYGVQSDDWVTAEHRFPVIRDFKSCFPGRKWCDSDFVPDVVTEDVQAIDIRPGDAVLLPSDACDRGDATTLSAGEFGEVACDDDLLRFLGWWLAEGCVSKSQHIRSSSFCLCASSERLVAQWLLEFAESRFGLHGKLEFRKNADNLLVHFHSARLARWLATFGLRAENKHVPLELWARLSQRQRLVLIKGVFDGDGNPATSTYGRQNVTTTSKVLANQVWQTAHAAGWEPNLTTHQPSTRNVKKRQRVWVVTWLTNRIQQRSGVRKTSLGLASLVRSVVTKNDLAAVYNLEVSGEHRYIAGNILTNNCLWDAATQRSTNRWRSGGPIPFNGGACPLCKGDGQAAMEKTQLVQLKVEWNPKKFIYPAPGVDLRVRYSVCETKGYLTDLPAIQQCDHMVVEVPIEGLITSKMKLAADPISPGNIIQGRYFICLWEAKG